MATALPFFGTSDSGNKNLLEVAQASGEFTANTLFKLLAWAVTGAVVDKRSSPPGSPAEGDAYRVGSSPTGDWSAFDEDDVALFIDNAWYEMDQFEGFRIYQEDTNQSLISDGTNWNEGVNSMDSGVTATGTTQGAGYAITLKVTEVTNITAASAEAATLPAAAAGLEFVVINNDSADTLKLFPATGDAIDGNAANASIDVTSGQIARLYAVDSTNWYSQIS